MKHNYFLVLALSVVASRGFALPPESKDSFSIFYLGKGTKLVLKTDLEIPANAGRLKLAYPAPNHYQDGCFIEVQPSVEDRKLSAGREIVLSGQNKAGQTAIVLKVERPQDITSITCTNAWDGKITIGRFKEAFLDQAELVFPEPSELPE